MLRWVLHHLEPVFRLSHFNLALIHDVVVIFDIINHVLDVLWMVLHHMIWPLRLTIFELAFSILLAVLLELLVELG